jgi:cysteine desulfuration protein SufE
MAPPAPAGDGPDVTASTNVNEVISAQRDLVDEFGIFDNWIDRYQYIIDLGRRLPEFPTASRIEENRIRGCQSQVWFTAEMTGDRLEFRAISDAAIVSGLIAMLLRIYSGKRPQDIVEAPAEFVSELQLEQHLSPTRSNGLSSMLSAIHRFAGEALAAT